MTAPARMAVITVSDGVAAGTRVDTAGDVVVALVASLPGEIVSRRTVADNVEDIQMAVDAALDVADIVVLTGGTGLGPRDVTPQAVEPLLDYEVPGIAEAMRAYGLQHTPHAMLSRQVVGVARGSLVLALPGSARAVAECLDAVWPALPHALALLRGETQHAAPGPPHLGPG